MRLSDFDFELPDTSIALRPANPRDCARLLLVEPDGPFQDRLVRDLPGLLEPGDVLVMNDTRVLPARLKGRRWRAEASVAVEATLLQRLSPSRWSAFMKPGRRLAPGDRIRFGRQTEDACSLGALEAMILEKAQDGQIILEFEIAGPDLDAAVVQIGEMPLPPYIAARRPEDEQDKRDYQTVYAGVEAASVAAPTAGLHFTPELLKALSDRGVGLEYVTLHVGAGTFLPVKVDDVSQHRMHAEYGHVPPDVAERLNAVRGRGGRLVCVGTTSLRLLESAATEDGMIEPFAAETSIFIKPGYRFRAADGLMTNFHLPKSTLFMLVCAFSGQGRMREAYRHAVETGYRFYSYGDSSLLWRNP